MVKSEHKELVLIIVIPILITWITMYPAFFYDIGFMANDPGVSHNKLTLYFILLPFMTVVGLLLFIPSIFIFMMWVSGISAWAELLFDITNSGAIDLVSFIVCVILQLGYMLAWDN